MKMDRPRGRVKNITGQGKSISKRGAGLGAGTVGTASKKRKTAAPIEDGLKTQRTATPLKKQKTATPRKKLT